MDRDERIMCAFKKASKLGFDEMSAQEITLVTGIPARAVHDRILSMKKYGEIIDAENPKRGEKQKTFRMNPQLL